MHKDKPLAENTEQQLERLRKEINRLDREILDLLSNRAKISLEVGQIKSSTSDCVFKPFREKDVLEQLLKDNPGVLPEDHLRAIYREIFSSSRSLQRPQRVAYLGPEGTFSYFAGLHYLGHSAQFEPANGLEEVFSSVRKKNTDLGIIPLENSLQGTVGQSLDLFLRYDVHIQAEIFCKISHSLLSTTDVLADIEVVHSHPQALQQCTQWIRFNLPQAEIIPEESTAAAARQIMNKKNEAAIGHLALAQLLGLKVVKKGIEDLPENWTRFLIIGSSAPFPGNQDKTSLLFTLPDKPGALANVLNLMAREGVNMKKLESRPTRGEKWQYVFFTDVECDLSKDEYVNLMQDMGKACHSLRVLGSYPNGPYLDVSLEQ